uniref:Cysteine rich secreted protein n=1 Tax=Riptortus pedestris TaxID=329032 RepID=R4WCH8_RIPPE|nr:cysteine rich secreted protein [Riptortus pedestris]
MAHKIAMLSLAVIIYLSISTVQGSPKGIGIVGKRNCPNGVYCPVGTECCMKNSDWVCCCCGEKSDEVTPSANITPRSRNITPLQHG